MRRFEMLSVLAMLFGSAAMAATIRPGGDPPADKVIWADPMDFYNQWAWDNREDPTKTRGTMWQGGPIPAGDPAGGYPTKAPNSGCDTLIQTNPADHEMARAQWFSNECGHILSPGGIDANPSNFQANIDPNCAGSGRIAVNQGEYALSDSTWGQGNYYSSMGQYTHYFGDRIQAIADYRGEGRKNAVAGTNEHPLVAIFYLNDGSVNGVWADQFDNSYVELSMIGELANRDDPNAMAPTNYIWMGDPTKTLPDMDACPEGPYPVICQQVRELNGTGAHESYYLDYVNAHCPAVNNTKTWRSIAVGYLAITDTDPCGVHYPINLGNAWGERHKPQALRLAVFDGHIWRQLAAGRYHGLNKNAGWPPAFPWDPGMQVGDPNSSDDFLLKGGTVRVVLKITTDWIMIYATTALGSTPAGYECGAAIPRTAPAYDGGFDSIRFGVGKGCELDPATGGCKSGGTPRQCMTYSRNNVVGYTRAILDSPSVLYGELRWEDTVRGRCCNPDGSCTYTDELTCTNAGGQFMGVNKTCDGTPCAGACCEPRGLCERLPINQCEGTFAGYGTLCTTQGICQCPTPFADFDRDGSVNMDDFAGFQACITDGTPAIAPACRCFDQNADGQIDETDFLKFAACATAEGVAWTATPQCME